MNYYVGMSRNLIRQRGATTKEMFGSQIVSLLISTITTRPVSTILRPILACDWVFYEVERSKRLDSGQMILRGIPVLLFCTSANYFTEYTFYFNRIILRDPGSGPG